MAVDIPSSTPAKRIPLEIFDIDIIVSDFRSFFSSDDYSVQIPTPIPLAWYSSKVESLVKVLLKYKSSTFQGIIFVEQCQIFLADLLELSPTCRALSAVLISLATASTVKGFPGILIAIKPKLFRDKEVNVCMFLLIVS